MTASLYPAQRSARYAVHVPARLAGQTPTAATYRRRRVGAVAFVLAVVVSVGSLAEQGLADRGAGPASGSTVGQAPYVVQPGDTLWSIAERLYPSADLPQVVDALVTVNGGASIQAGQTLTMP
jgi:Tfp pilus assembly protein FimV